MVIIILKNKPNKKIYTTLYVHKYPLIIFIFYYFNLIHIYIYIHILRIILDIIYILFTQILNCINYIDYTERKHVDNVSHLRQTE